MFRCKLFIFIKFNTDRLDGSMVLDVQLANLVLFSTQHKASKTPRIAKLTHLSAIAAYAP
jgi:hypothetical protein